MLVNAKFRLWDCPEIRNARMLASANRGGPRLSSGRDLKARPYSAHPPKTTLRSAFSTLIRHARAPTRASAPLSRTNASAISVDHRVKPGDDDVREIVRSWDIAEIRTARMFAGGIRACLGVASGRDSKRLVSGSHPPFRTLNPYVLKVQVRGRL